MKKIIFMLGISIALFSCSNENKMKSEIKDYLEKNAKDPKSYEFVDLTIIDTLTVSEFAESRIAFNNENKRFCDSVINNFDADKNKKELDFMGENLNTPEKHEESLKDAKSTLEKGNAENVIMNKFKDSKDVLIYCANHNFRMKNGFGALDLNNMNAFFDTNFKLLSLKKEKYYSETSKDSIFKINFLEKK